MARRLGAGPLGQPVHEARPGPGLSRGACCCLTSGGVLTCTRALGVGEWPCDSQGRRRISQSTGPEAAVGLAYRGQTKHGHLACTPLATDLGGQTLPGGHTSVPGLGVLGPEGDSLEHRPCVLGFGGPTPPTQTPPGPVVCTCVSATSPVPTAVSGTARNLRGPPDCWT